MSEAQSTTTEEEARELTRVKNSFAEFCHRLLESHAHSFTIGPATFAAATWREPENSPHANTLDLRVVSVAAIRLILDWATNDFAMSLPEFLSGMFLGREWDKTTPPWRLIPEVKDRITAESLGFDHLYPKKSE